MTARRRRRRLGRGRPGLPDAASCTPPSSCRRRRRNRPAYEQGGRPKESLELFQRALAVVRPDQVTLVAALSACAQLGAMGMGRWIHAYMEKNGVGLNSHLATSLIDMYSKCGDLDQALELFHSAAGEADVFVWSAMITGLGMYGEGKAAVDLFLQMQEKKASDQVRPNGVTFINLLSSCSHAGLVEEGKRYFQEMLPVHGVEPGVEHYGVMVDILARAGRFEEATELIARMPMTPHASVWGALLGACAKHSSSTTGRLGEEAGERLLELEPGNDGAYVLLSNLYAKSGEPASPASLFLPSSLEGADTMEGCGGRPNAGDLPSPASTSTAVVDLQSRRRQSPPPRARRDPQQSRK